MGIKNPDLITWFLEISNKIVMKIERDEEEMDLPPHSKMKKCSVSIIQITLR